MSIISDVSRAEIELSAIRKSSFSQAIMSLQKAGNGTLDRFNNVQSISNVFPFLSAFCFPWTGNNNAQGRTTPRGLGTP